MKEQNKETGPNTESKIDDVQNAVNELSDALDKYESVQLKYRNLADENDELMERMNTEWLKFYDSIRREQNGRD
jgi:predicted  nucleic acid-binding Zn-ribbon protein